MDSRKEIKRKEDFIKKHGWGSLWSEDNWVLQRWIDEGKNVDLMGLSLDDAYDQCLVILEQEKKGWFHENGQLVKKPV